MQSIHVRMPAKGKYKFQKQNSKIRRIEMSVNSTLLGLVLGAALAAPAFSQEEASNNEASAQVSSAFVYGGRADFNLSKHIFMRAQYRGFEYNSPTYDFAGLDGLDRTTHRAEPSVGFGYRF